jgi:hypothetical protein
MYVSRYTHPAPCPPPVQRKHAVEIKAAGDAMIVERGENTRQVDGLQSTLSADHRAQIKVMKKEFAAELEASKADTVARVTELSVRHLPFRCVSRMSPWVYFLFCASAHCCAYPSTSCALKLMLHVSSVQGQIAEREALTAAASEKHKVRIACVPCVRGSSRECGVETD